jgi:phospholipid transport system transporter-binding protein
LIQAPVHSAAFEMQTGERSRLSGTLHFTTVSALLGQGEAAIESGRAAVIDLGSVAESDSAGLALLIEWLSVAKEAKRALRYENIPEQIQELARLSEVEPLLTSGTP